MKILWLPDEEADVARSIWRGGMEVIDRESQFDLTFALVGGRVIWRGRYGASVYDVGLLQGGKVIFTCEPYEEDKLIAFLQTLEPLE